MYRSCTTSPSNKELNYLGYIGKEDCEIHSLLVIFNHLTPLNSQVNLRIVEESELFGDMLVENFQESYLNLTVKSLMLVKFAALTDVDTDFVFKVSPFLQATGR